jgi:sarcosine oxidase/L-pipecolate oxidase
MDYDIVVVGSGMFGSSAAKYLKQQNPSLNILLAGPWNSQTNRSDFFSSHDDVSRLYRHQAGANSNLGEEKSHLLTSFDFEGLSESDFWSSVSSLSIQRFPEIASKSCVPFYTPVGFLAVGHSSSPYMKGLIASACPPLTIVHSSFESFHDSFPYILSSTAFPSPSFAAVHVPFNAGYLNPNKLIEAQRQIFISMGGSTADSVLCSSIVQASDHVLVNLRALSPVGPLLSPVKCRRALLSAGAFSATVPVFSESLGPSMSNSSILLPKTQVCALFEIEEVDVKQTLKNMPTMIFAGPTKGLKGKGEDGGNISLETELDSAYIVPPIYYESEMKWYLKIGHGKKLEYDIDSKDLTALSSWYCERLGSSSFAFGSSPPPLDTPALALCAIFRHIFPSISPRSVKIINAGVTADTPHGKPVCCMAKGDLDRIGFVMGGNGYGAKACDEIGRIASEMISEGLLRDGTAQ